MLKKEISLHFDKASIQYDQVSFAQQTVARYLSSFVQSYWLESQKAPPTTILDIGTGTGYMSELLHSQFSSAHFTLNDISASMLNIASQKMQEKKISHHTSLLDMDCFDVKAFEPQDLIVSNLCLQWSDNLPKLLTQLYQIGSVIAFSCLLEGTFAGWSTHLKTHHIHNTVPKYPNLEKLLETIKAAQKKTPDIVCQHVLEIPLHFASSKDFMYYLKHLGANTTEIPLSIGQTKKLLQDSSAIHTQYKVWMGLIVPLPNENS
jgi:malonyl-CoA O-methyltransferase